ncbi:MAG: hypothetical protein ACTSX8_11000 [Alphaproteobacteria bacterium]
MLNSKKLLLVIICALLGGCATVTTPSGFTIKYVKMPLLDTTGAISYRHEWLDAENVLHEERLDINADMGSQNQLDALKAGLAAGAAIKGAGL